ncbi:MAG: hypothetical protein CVU40_13130 [Chloroflexi bacterium HGW-Chloroflexi-2]|nr:MAG: hypothetical protein CVU40_13130 [Chloroflexi bacterium HGW-Chloroflexi-2]
MSPRNWQLRIKDMILCCENIQNFTSSSNFDEFLNDPKTIRAVAFELSTLGEAVRALPEDIKNRHSEIPWEKIQGIRNVLIHEYFRLDEEIIWKTVQQDIPNLKSLLEYIDLDK